MLMIAMRLPKPIAFKKTSIPLSDTPLVTSITEDVRLNLGDLLMQQKIVRLALLVLFTAAIH